MPRARISPWKAAVPGAFVVLAVAACGSAYGSSPASSSPSASATSASGTQTTALCQSLVSLRATTTSFDHLTPSSATAATVTSDIQAMTTDLTHVAQADSSQFAPQANGLSSALGTLRSRITGLSNGTASESSVTDAAKNVEANAVDLAIATRNACPSVSSS